MTESPDPETGGTPAVSIVIEGEDAVARAAPQDHGLVVEQGDRRAGGLAVAKDQEEPGFGLPGDGHRLHLPGGGVEGGVDGVAHGRRRYHRLAAA